jgi:hypothetical protein
MDISDVMKLIRPELLIVIPFCWGFGMFLKSIKEFPNRFIPATLCLFSIILTTLFILGEHADVDRYIKVFTILTQSIALWAMSWISYEKYIKHGISLCILSNTCNKSEDVEEKKDIL